MRLVFGNIRSYYGDEWQCLALQHYDDDEVV